MAVVRVLNKGWARRVGAGWETVPTTVLVDTDGKKIIVDPGNDPQLSDMLERRFVWPEEIDHVFLTHSHLDHILNLGLFTDADVLDATDIYSGTRISPHEGKIPGTGIPIIPTPGHTADHASLLVPTKEGNVMICGDLFWWEEGVEVRTDIRSLLGLRDSLAVDQTTLLESRSKALRTGAVRFIPGHGESFSLDERLPCPSSPMRGTKIQ